MLQNNNNKKTITTYNTTWMYEYLTHLMLSERKQKQENIYKMIPFVQSPRTIQN